jgi:hypothetical protein
MTQTRTLRRSAVVAVATAAMLGGAAPAQADHHSWKHVRTECIAKENPYTGGYLISALTRWTMSANAHKKNNLRKFIIKARLVPTTAGHNWFRNWAKHFRAVKVGHEDRSFNQIPIGVRTESQSDTYDWNVEVDLRWDRKFKRDWHVRTTIPFNEGFCATG